jgi:hypothetical protein
VGFFFMVSITAFGAHSMAGQRALRDGGIECGDVYRANPAYRSDQVFKVHYDFDPVRLGGQTVKHTRNSHRKGGSQQFSKYSLTKAT